MAVIGILVSIAIPNFRGMQQQGNLSQAEAELNTLKSAVVTYWKNHDFTYPPNIHSALLSELVPIIPRKLSDSFNTDTTNNTYGYLTGSDTIFGSYFIVYTKGPEGDTSPTWDSTTHTVHYTGSGLVVSSAPVYKD